MAAQKCARHCARGISDAPRPLGLVAARTGAERRSPPDAAIPPSWLPVHPAPAREHGRLLVARHDRKLRSAGPEALTS